jgi:hypothetical protein
MALGQVAGSASLRSINAIPLIAVKDDHSSVGKGIELHSSAVGTVGTHHSLEERYGALRQSHNGAVGSLNI